MKNLNQIATRINNFYAYYEMSNSNDKFIKWTREEKDIIELLSECTPTELYEIKSLVPEEKQYIIERYFTIQFDTARPPSRPTPSKSKVMKTAWAIFKSGFAVSFGQALRKAWVLIKITLGNGIKISYAKETGELREAVALQLGGLSTITKGFIRYMENINGSNQWRSFRIERLAL